MTNVSAAEQCFSSSSQCQIRCFDKIPYEEIAQCIFWVFQKIWKDCYHACNILLLAICYSLASLAVCWAHQPALELLLVQMEIDNSASKLQYKRHVASSTDIRKFVHVSACPTSGRHPSAAMQVVIAHSNQLTSPATSTQLQLLARHPMHDCIYEVQRQVHFPILS